MKPFVLPASTVTTALAGGLSIIIVWLIKEFAKVDVPNEVQGALTLVMSVATAHFTTDAPSVTKVETPAPEQNKIEEVNKKDIEK